MRGRPALALALLTVAFAPVAAQAAPSLEKVGDFTAPVHVASPPGDARLFVVERAGRVKVVAEDGTIRPAPFLDASALTTVDGERGMLSITFAPDYASSGLAYVFLTEKGTGTLLRGRDPHAGRLRGPGRRAVVR